MFNFIKNIGPTEIALIAIVFILIFGAGIAAKLGKTSGQTLREIRNVKKTFGEALDDDGGKGNDKEASA